MGRRKPLAVEAPEFESRAQHSAGKRGQRGGKQEHSAVRKRRDRTLRRTDKEVRGKFPPRPLRRRIAPLREGRRVPRFPLRLYKPRRVVPFAAHLMGQEQPLRLLYKFGMAGKKHRDLLFVLAGLERAGGIDERPAARKQPRGVVQNGALPCGAVRHVLRAPLPDGDRILAEHALARTGSIDEDLIEIRGQRGGKRCRVCVDRGAVCHAQPLDVLRKDARAVIDVFVCYEHPLPAHGCGELRRLSSGRGAQIEHPFARLHVQQRRGAHGGRLLRIEQPCVMGGGMPRFFRIRIKTVLRPRNRFPGKGCKRGKLRRRELQKVGAHPPDGRVFIRTQKGGVRRAQPFLHFL